MREILYRGKRTDLASEDIISDRWVYGSYHNSENNKDHYIIQKVSFINVYNGAVSLMATEVFNVIPETVAQFIGVEDMDGKKIFTDMLVQVAGNVIYRICFIGKNSDDVGDEIHAAFHGVCLNKIGQTISIPIDSYFLKNCRVIGNIHDNHELLKP